MISPPTLSARIDELAGRRRVRIGVGLGTADPRLIAELEGCARIADIVVVGPPTLEMPAAWEVKTAAEPEKILASMLASGEVEGLLRGTLDGAKTTETYMHASGDRDSTCPGLAENASGRQFFLSAISNPEGATSQRRLHETKLTADFMRKLGIEPQIAVYTAARHGTVERLAQRTDPVGIALAETYREAEWLVKVLKADGLNAANMTIELNVAIDQGYDLHVPVSGVVGNQIIRAFMASGGKLVAAPRIGFSRPYEENSRTEGSIAHHVRWLATLINN